MRRWGNILVFGVKHGENAPAEENIPENATKHGGNEVVVEKHPGFAGKTWRNCSRKEKCPEKRHNSGRKLWGGGETSWFWG